MSKTTILIALIGLAGCSRSGMGEGVRQDITARMVSAQAPLSSCYERALKERRKLRGIMWLRFDIEAESGKFSNVAITRNEVPNEGLETCVIQTVAGLVLQAPQKSVVSVEYPVRFTPSNDAPPP